VQRTSAPTHSRLLVTILVLILSATLVLASVVVLINRPPSEQVLAATLAALPTFTLPPTVTPTPIPTLPGVNDALLVCQRTVGFELNERYLVAAANISDNHLLSLSWVAQNWQVNHLSDALPGIVLVFDAAVEAWKDGCAVYDRAQVKVWDCRGDQLIHRLDVEVMVDDLLKWRNGEIGDQTLIQRLQVTYYP